MSDSITSLIGLKDEDVEYCKEVIRSDGGVKHRLFYVRLVNHGGRCQKCGTFTKCIKEYRQKKIDHSIIIKEKVRSVILPEGSNVRNAETHFMKKIRLSHNTAVYPIQQSPKC